MAAPAWVAPAIQGGTGIAGGVISAAVQGKRDHDSRNFALMQGDIENQRNREAWNLQNQRDDETWNRQNAKNMELWNLQNDYNSPANQMKRFKEAGLNPHLIYGQQSNGGSVQTANLDSGKLQGGGRPANWQPGARDTSFIGSSLMDIFVIREKSAQIDNLKEQNNVLQQEAALKHAQELATLAGTDATRTGIEETRVRTDRARFDYDLESELRKTSVDARKAALRRSIVDSDIALAQEARAKGKFPVDMQSLRQSIENMQGDKINKTFDSELKSLEIQLKKNPKGTELLNRFGGSILTELKDILYKEYTSPIKR